ncbi:PDR/VanB family oxidoreductase [Pseudonocardia kujensis]|uniref:PDR/VanB family oxidoreductase n=1 Tax=Pseudonocardia kujensis TaxID=1128675 RepID=UPI001E53B8BB|nr:PDR/VanB family oxidoreductase [Pseudonocardia kujensis]MCE0764604.1 PDR/VanB family oxidoreductase [Pseudonocardia kujensis]
MGLELVVTSKDMTAEDVAVFRMRRADGGELPEWEPGAHVGVTVKGAIRQYSLCGEPSDRLSWRIAVRRDPEGKVSRDLHDQVSVGQRLQVDAPRNQFPLVEAERYLFIAGGIGITPFLPMIAQAEKEGKDWRLVYGGRSRAHMGFLAELDSPRVTLWPEDERGLLPLATLLEQVTDDTAVYCCGPGPLIEAVSRLCVERPVGSLHFERFEPAGVDEGAGSFTVELRRSGLTLEVPADKTLLEVLEAAGVSILSSCRTGTCGTCEASVLAGEPDHRDEILTGEERTNGKLIMLCVSRSNSPTLALDL